MSFVAGHVDRFSATLSMTGASKFEIPPVSAVIIREIHRESILPNLTLAPARR
jgi:hypothetical protein